MKKLCLVSVTVFIAGFLVSCDQSSPPSADSTASAPASKKSQTTQATETIVNVFSEEAQQRGLAFTHYSAGSARYYFPEIMGSGVALLDYDNDGDLDVFVAQGDTLSKEVTSTELRTPREFSASDKLFENRLIPDGNLSFIDQTAQSGIELAGFSMGVSTADIDNDGYVDIYISRYGSNTLLRNKGNGQFEDVTKSSGANDERWNSSASFFDYDQDGDLDLFVTAYVAFNLNYEKQCKSPGGAPDYCSPKAYKPLVDRLFENDGSGQFVDATEKSGLGSGVGSGLGSVFDDFNGDGLLDLYVANDGNPNFLWLKQSDGRFTQQGIMSGSAYNQDGKVEASMGVVAGDYDNDGDPDLFMTHLRQESNTLYVNNGTGIFQDSTMRTQLKRPSLPLTGFGTVWIDYDNDRWLDLYVTNGGVVAEFEEHPRTDKAYQQRDQLYKNENGKRFIDRSELSGDAMQRKTIGRGVAKGDIDNDGDLDLVINDNNGPLRLLINQVGNQQNWLRVKLQSAGANRQALGARVGLLDSNGHVIWRRMRTDGSYQSANEAVVHFGLGDLTSKQSIVVEWPSGEQEIWKDLEPNQLISLSQGTGAEFK